MVIFFENVVDNWMAISIDSENIAVVAHLPPNMAPYKPKLIALREFDRNHPGDMNTAIKKITLIKISRNIKKSILLNVQQLKFIERNQQKFHKYIVKENNKQY